MSKSLKLVLIIFLVSAISNLSAFANYRGSVSFVSPGTPMQAVVNEALSSEFTRVGEIITLALSAPVYSGSTVAIPAGTLVEAEVIEAKPAGRAGQPGRLEFKLRALVTPAGSRIPISASLDKNRFSLTAENHAQVKHYAKATVAGAAGGALSGLIGGAISGGSVGKGAALGTAVGSGVGILGGTVKRGKELVIPKGTPIPFVLDQTLRIGSGGASPSYSAPSYPEANFAPPSANPGFGFQGQPPAQPNAFADPTRPSYPSSGAFQDPGQIYQQQNQNPYY